MKTEREIAKVRDDLWATCVSVAGDDEFKASFIGYMHYIAAIDWVLESSHFQAENPLGEFVRLLKESKRRLAEMN